MAVLMTSAGDDSKWMETGRPNRTYQDITGHMPGNIHTNHWGWAPFRTPGGKVCVWVEV
jgi:alpha-amylase